MAVSLEYSAYVCEGCVNNLQAAAKIKQDFLEIDAFWKSIIESGQSFGEEDVDKPNFENEKEPYNSRETIDYDVVDVDVDYEDEAINKRNGENSYDQTKQAEKSVHKLSQLYECDMCGKKKDTR